MWSVIMDLKKDDLNPKLHINIKRERGKFIIYFKAEVALVAMKEKLTIVELAQKQR